MRKLSGFTLVECLVALMVLGILSVTLAGVYAAVAKGRRENEYMNYSLAEQMKYVEGFDKESTQRVEIKPTAGQVSGEKTAAVPAPATGTYKVTIKGGPVGSGGTVAAADSHDYAYGITMYILYSRDINDIGSNDTTGTYAYPAESDSKLRYKYLQPRTPGQVS